jgi:hypothetical protein
MTVELINFVVPWLNAFPPSSGLSQTYSPRTIMTGTTLDYSKHCRLFFGAYVETHEENNPTNTMKEITRGAICLGPTANFQGSYKLLCLRKGRRITRKQFKELSMPASVISAVEALAARDKQEGNLEFTDRHGNSFADDTSDADPPAEGRAGVDEGGNEENEDAQGDDDDDEEDEAPGILTGTPGAAELPDAVIPGVAEHTGGIEITGVQGPTRGIEIP